MTKAKRYPHNQALAHAWARQATPDGRSSNSPQVGCPLMSFNGALLYSYRACIARILPGERVVVHTHQRWTPTTSEHQRLARQASCHLPRVCAWDPSAGAARNRCYAIEEMEKADRNIKVETRKDGVETVNSKKRNDALRADMLNAARRFNEYLEAVHAAGEDLDVVPIDTSNLDDFAAVLQRQEEEERQRRAAAAAARAEQQREGLERWRAGGPLGSFNDLPVALRLLKGLPRGGTPGMTPEAYVSVQTSRGAEIPVDDAKRLWPILLRVKHAGAEMAFGAFQLGAYSLDRIYPNGDIKVGCHLIPFAELEKMAVQLGLVYVEAA